jgi:hypothetical protein
MRHFEDSTFLAYFHPGFRPLLQGADDAARTLKSGRLRLGPVTGYEEIET